MSRPPPSSPRFSESVHRRTCVRVVVGIERLLTWPERLRYMFEVHADTGPGRGAPAHRVDQDVRWAEVGGGPGMTRLPALEPGQRLLLLRGAADLDQRLRGHAPAARLRSALPARGLDARRLARLFRVVRRPGRIAEARRFLPRRQLQQRLQRAGTPVDARVPVADGGEASGHRAPRGVLGLALEELVPGHGRGDPGVGVGAHRVGARDRAVLGILVVVEEHAVALLLPPLAGGERWRPPLDLTRERQGGAPHLRERPALMDADVDVDAPRARGLGPAYQTEIGQYLLDHAGDVSDLGPLDVRHRVEVD